MEFIDFNLSNEVLRAVTDAGYSEPTEIQQQSIPLMLEGKDIIGNSQTGSGKTAAFGLPAIEIVDYDAPKKYIQILILCPTRELALQAKEELSRFSKYKAGLHIVAIYGGESIEKQIGQLKRGCQIIVGTPGRVMDHMRRKTIKLDKLKTLVLDEADEMLNFGFREDIETILKETPQERQTVLFSATMPKEILDITNNYQREPVMLKIKNKTLTVSTIEQSYFEMPRSRKCDALAILLQYYKPELSIVFCNTKKMVDDVSAYLKKSGYKAEALHGDIKQTARTAIMNRFKSNSFNILVATDVAARGIDVNNIDIVFNFDIPQDHEYYVHRIGRTGRAGKCGRSFTFVNDENQYQELMRIARYTKSSIQRQTMPRISDIQTKNTDLFLTQFNEEITNRRIHNRDKELQQLTECGYSTEDIALVLLDMYLNKKEKTISTNDIAICDFSKEREHLSSHSGRKRPAKERSRRQNSDISMSKIIISLGRKDRIAPKNILGAVTGESGVPGSLMGSIEISHEYSTIDVPSEYKNKIVKALNKAKFNNKPIYAK